MKENKVNVELTKEELSWLFMIISEYSDKYEKSETVQQKATKVEDKLWQGIEQMRKLLEENK